MRGRWSAPQSCDGCRLQQMHSLKGRVPVPVVGPELGPRDLVHIIVILRCLLVQRILALRHSLPSNIISNIIKNNPPHNYSALPLRSLFPFTHPTSIHFPSHSPSFPYASSKKNQSTCLRCSCLLLTPCASNRFPAGLQPCIINPSAFFESQGKDIKLGGKQAHRLGKEVVSVTGAAKRELEKGHP